MNSAAESIHVLHVDDESDVAELAAEFLERKDERFAVDTATSASDGLDRLTDTDYDCIVSDYDMPGQDGIDFLKAVRERHPELPFILYTGKGTEAIASEAISAGVTDYLQKEGGTDQYTVLANRVTNAIEQYQLSQRTAQLERLRSVVKDANLALLRAETRSEIEQQICEVISDADPYLFAWFGEHDPDAQTVEPRAAAGIGEGYLDAIEITTDEQATAQGPTGQAVRTQEGQAVRTQEIVAEQEIAESPEYEQWRDVALDRGYQSSAAIPITRDNSALGVLNVYADHPHAFDDEEQELLADLATDTGQALDRIERAERLQLFGAAVEAAGHSIYFTDTEGTIEYVNPAFEEVTGYTAEEAVGRNPRILQSGEHDEAFYEELWDTILAGDVWRNELINTTKSGDRYVIDQTIAPVRAEDDAINHFVAVNSDITERKQREHRFAAVFNNTFQFTGLLEPDGTIIEVNETALGFEDLQREEVVGKHLAETGWIREENRERVREAVERAREGELDRFEMEINGSDGPVVIDFSLKPMTNEHGEIGLLIPEGRDITEHKQRTEELQQIEAKLRTQTNFATVLNRVLRHNLRNDITVIRGHIERIADQLDDESTVEIVLNHIDGLIDLSEKARDLEKVINDSSERHHTEIGALIEDVVESIEPEYPASSISVEYDDEIHVDVLQSFDRAVEELIENAAKHSGDSPTVTVAVETLPNAVEIQISDDGPGLADDEIEVLETGAETPLTHGTGVGLWMAHWIVSSHDGSIDPVVTENGTTMTITLPRKPAGGGQQQLTELTRSLDKYKATFEEATDAIAIVNDDGRIMEANPGTETLFGVESKELAGRSLTELLPDEFEFNTDWQDFQQAGDERDTVTFIRADGEERVLEYSVIANIIPGQHLFISRDITERKERERERRYNAIFNTTSPDAIILHDAQGAIHGVNQQTIENFGYTREQLLSMEISEIDVDYDQEELATLWAGISDGERETVEGRHRRADGSTFPVEVSIRKIDLDGEERFLTLSRDITVHKERERQLQRERDRLDEFAGVVSHDLRNPLNVAKGRLDFAMEDCASEHLGPVVQALNRMESIIDDVLSLARAGESVGEMEPVELADLVEACRQTVKTASAELVVETETTIQADATRLKQLFENLVRNAVEHGGEDVTITVGDLPDGFQVEDDGPGIPEDERGNVFDAGYSTAADGTGLGLSIVREVAEAHGWEIEVTEGVTGGARFEVTGVQKDG